MTERKILFALKRIESCKKKGFELEALLKSYHLNVELIKYILNTCSEEYAPGNKKIKAVFHHFLGEVSVNPKLKAVLNKKNAKALKPWLDKMEQFFKTLKLRQPANIKVLQHESEQVTGLLNISLVKLQHST